MYSLKETATNHFVGALWKLIGHLIDVFCFTRNLSVASKWSILQRSSMMNYEHRCIGSALNYRTRDFRLWAARPKGGRQAFDIVDGALRRKIIRRGYSGYPNARQIFFTRAKPHSTLCIVYSLTKLFISSCAPFCRYFTLIFERRRLPLVYSVTMMIIIIITIIIY